MGIAKSASYELVSCEGKKKHNIKMDVCCTEVGLGAFLKMVTTYRDHSQTGQKMSQSLQTGCIENKTLAKSTFWSFSTLQHLTDLVKLNILISWEYYLNLFIFIIRFK